MEDKLFYFTSTPSVVLWKDVKNSVQNETLEWSFKKDSSGNNVGSMNLTKAHKLYVTLIGGGGSGSLGEKRPINNTIFYARDHDSYNEYTNMFPLPGCGGGGGATIFRIPIISIQSLNTVVDYSVGKGGTGMVDTKDDPIKPAIQRVGKSGENTSLIIKQRNNQRDIHHTFRIHFHHGQFCIWLYFLSVSHSDDTFSCNSVSLSSKWSFCCYFSNFYF